jgi:hypothetical protein
MKFRYIIFILAAMTAVHFSALVFGLYAGKVWVDKPLHFVGGVVLAMIGYWLLEIPSIKSRLGMPSSLATALLVIGFTLFGGLLWEIFEYVFLQVSPTYALKLKFYSPLVSDLLSDIIMDMLGGAVTVFFMNKQWKISNPG